jgi:hypothetical protein
MGSSGSAFSNWLAIAMSMVFLALVGIMWSFRMGVFPVLSSRESTSSWIGNFPTQRYVHFLRPMVSSLRLSTGCRLG